MNFLTVLFSIRNISKDDHALINVLRQRRTRTHNVCWESFLGRIWPGQPWTADEETKRLKGSGSLRSGCTSKFWKKIALVEEGGAHLQSWNCSARLQKSERNWKENEHFTVVCSPCCNLQSM